MNQTDGCQNLDDLFSQYPQVVVLCGHTHASIMDETSISQTEYTAINTQCTSYICFEDCELDQEGGALIEDNPMAMILEIKDNQAVFHRYSVLTWKEQKEPWVLNYPVPNDNFTYTYDNRKKASPAPHWANDFECSWQDVKFNDMNTKETSFTAASHPDGVFYYFFEFFDSNGNPVEFDVNGVKKTELCSSADAYLPEEERNNIVNIPFKAEYLENLRGKYTVKITAADCFKNKSESKTVSVDL
ncbi:MAG: hypothetical protein LIO43_04235 [Clostridiales bacterium]|nr:hypothetical protein [Clostridiales bacterium]